MNYLALYRKYRPQKFEEVVGQEAIVKVLKNSINNNMISHAYLFSGPRGTGKTTIAKLMAKLINCSNPIDNNPCENCPSCLALNNKNNPDIIEMDAASNNGVDEIREIRDKVSLMPSMSKYKVYIIDEVHMLSTGAFNALLKTLEEPPKHAIFILATTEFYKVPETIISRCQCFDFEKISNDNIINKLTYIVEKENLNVSSDVLPLISKYSDGGLRDAINMLDKLVCCSSNVTIDEFYELRGLIRTEEIEKIYNNLINKDINILFETINELTNKGKNLFVLVEELINYVKNIILLNSKQNKFACDKQLFDIITILNETLNNMKSSSSSKIMFEIGMLKIINDINIEKIVDKQIDENCDKNVFSNELKNISKEIISISSKKEKTKDIPKIVEKTNINSILLDNMKIRVNNSFALANKQILEDLKIQWIGFSDYLYNKEFGPIVSYLIDGNLRVAGEKDIIISVKYDSILTNALLNLQTIESLFSIVTGKYFKIAFILDDEWNELKKKYISDHKNGVIYSYQEEKSITLEMENKEQISTIPSSEVVNQALSLFGNEIVEIK